MNPIPINFSDRMIRRSLKFIKRLPSIILQPNEPSISDVLSPQQSTADEPETDKVEELSSPEVENFNSNLHPPFHNSNLHSSFPVNGEVLNGNWIFKEENLEQVCALVRKSFFLNSTFLSSILTFTFELRNVGNCLPHWVAQPPPLFDPMWNNDKSFLTMYVCSHMLVLDKTCK